MMASFLIPETRKINIGLYYFWKKLKESELRELSYLISWSWGRWKCWVRCGLSSGWSICRLSFVESSNITVENTSRLTF